MLNHFGGAILVHDGVCACQERWRYFRTVMYLGSAERAIGLKSATASHAKLPRWMADVDTTQMIIRIAQFLFEVVATI